MKKEITFVRSMNNSLSVLYLIIMITNNEQIDRIEELLMAIPTLMCRNMDQQFVSVILNDISKDLAKHHFMILKMLNEKKKFFVTEIVNTLGITKSQMTASIDKLIKLEYVERFADTKDRRKIYVSITVNGKAVTEKICQRMKDVFKGKIESLTKTEIEDLEKGLVILTKFCSNCGQEK